MARKQKPKQKLDLSADAPLTNNPFAGLAGLRASLPEAAPAEAPPTTPSPAAPEVEPPAKGPAKAVIRYQRKGRGGKEVTVVEQLKLDPEQAQLWCREIKRSLGCGGQVEGEELVFAGDQRERLPGLLRDRGVRRVVGG